MIRKTLGEYADDTRPLAISRSGPLVFTDRGSVLEVAGGSHATSIVNDGGEILRKLSHVCSEKRFFVGSGRQYANEEQINLASTVLALGQMEDGLVFFTSGGTESFETAIRLAHHVQSIREYHNKTMILGHPQSYYGMSLAARNAADHPVHSNIPEGLKFSWPKLPFPITENISRMQEILSFYSESVAAVIIEPISGTTGGAIEASELYLRELRSMCDYIGAILIIDETVTGFGRLGQGLLSTKYKPDIVFGGKCLAGSFAPISAVILAQPLCNEFRNDGGQLPLRLTFSGNSLACAAANIVQDYMNSNGIYKQVRANSQHIQDLLENFTDRLGEKVWYTGLGHHWAIHCSVANGTSGATLNKIKENANSSGIEFLGAAKVISGNESVHIMLTPALDVTSDQIETLVLACVSLVERSIL
jgi:adenosylmethionine-8-amino-7-oxononanoate aminotransferase